MQLDYTIYTRSRSEKLYGMMSEFLSKNKLVRVTGFDGYEGARDYLYYILENSTSDWVVNIDEDCFVYNPVEIKNIISNMSYSGQHYAGMPDRGVCPHRMFSWHTHNPFFNVFNAKEIRKKLKEFDKEEINKFSVYEPFDGLFSWLCGHFESYDLDATQFDEISTELKFDSNFLIHTWYSREYEIDLFHTERINNAYEYAKWKLQN